MPIPLTVDARIRLQEEMHYYKHHSLFLVNARYLEKHPGSSGFVPPPKAWGKRKETDDGYKG
jgi:hypothetical protein